MEIMMGNRNWVRWLGTVRAVVHFLGGVKGMAGVGAGVGDYTCLFEMPEGRFRSACQLLELAEMGVSGIRVGEKRRWVTPESVAECSLLVAEGLARAGFGVEGPDELKRAIIGLKECLTNVRELRIGVRMRELERLARCFEEMAILCELELAEVAYV
jgi:hypothetical protein